MSNATLVDLMSLSQSLQKEVQFHYQKGEELNRKREAEMRKLELASRLPNQTFLKAVGDMKKSPDKDRGLDSGLQDRALKAITLWMEGLSNESFEIILQTLQGEVNSLVKEKIAIADLLKGIEQEVKKLPVQRRGVYVNQLEGARQERASLSEQILAKESVLRKARQSKAFDWRGRKYMASLLPEESQRAFGEACRLLHKFTRQYGHHALRESLLLEFYETFRDRIVLWKQR